MVIEKELAKIKELEKQLREELDDVQAEPIARKLEESFEDVYREIGRIKDPLKQATALREIEEIVERSTQLEQIAKEKLGFNPFKKER